MEDFPIAMLDYWRVMGIEATSRGIMKYHGNQGNNRNFDERTNGYVISMGTTNGNFSKRESDSIGETNGEHVEFKALYPFIMGTPISTQKSMGM